MFFRAAMFSFICLLPFSNAFSSEEKLISGNWKFKGVFGTVDKKAAQRGFQVFKEVCSTCHSLKYLSFRNLEAIGFSQNEIKAIAAEHDYKDKNESGEDIDRKGRPSDYFLSANSNAFPVAPPDLSLIVKARHNGADYVYSLLQGYSDSGPDDGGLYTNKYFPGHKIAMPVPLSDGMIEYQDGTNASLKQMSNDVVTFLQWVSEPEMRERKVLGLKVMIILSVLTVLSVFAKRAIWDRLKK